ncbi:hypothetical protein OS493_026605 [Desmophyllum pertusum]|uniref:Glutamate dehydrogenase n=1 Tax=Desmophyllum pertusum TaxID=174260 RepID=A0A9X0CD65_9CNID|nr:hypothetical protein OS493_026605 [Desmophyllum pertusum]
MFLRSIASRFSIQRGSLLLRRVPVRCASGVHQTQAIVENGDTSGEGNMKFKSLDDFIGHVVKKNPGEHEFHQAVHEVISSLWDYLQVNNELLNSNILERIVEPERVVIFRVPWRDDNGEVHVNRGFRVEFNSAIGPYKGGLRFHPSVNLGILKFLGFEQVFKNSLTTLPLGGGKGGSDFDPKGKSDNEVMNFCQSFMSELQRHIGPNTDVPAGDIGVGGREIGYLFGQYKKIRNEFTGVLTGKSFSFGGSMLRPEATGYGLVYFTVEMLSTRGETFRGKTVTVSGSGNVAQFAAEKVLHLGGKVVTLSDSEGTLYDNAGLDKEKIEYVKWLKNVKRGRISEFVERFPDAKFFAGKRPWFVNCDVALPCATQNEVSKEDAEMLIRDGCYCVAEGANMPSAPEAIEVFQEHKILYGPGKASNAGGVAVSGLEMSQNSLRSAWTREGVDERLHDIMESIHNTCVKYGTSKDGSYIDYVKGANVGGFIKVAQSMLEQGIV